MSRILSYLNRQMAFYLRRHGWVVFYLEERHRHCRDGMCWLKLYQSEEGDKEKLS